MFIAFYIGVGMIIWLNLASVMLFPPITDQFLHIYTNDFKVIHVTFEKRKRMKTLNCILSAMAIIACFRYGQEMNFAFL